MMAESTAYPETGLLLGNSLEHMTAISAGFLVVTTLRVAIFLISYFSSIIFIVFI